MRRLCEREATGSLICCRNEMRVGVGTKKRMIQKVPNLFGQALCCLKGGECLGEPHPDTLNCNSGAFGGPGGTWREVKGGSVYMFYKENVFMCHFCDLQSVFKALSWSG